MHRHKCANPLLTSYLGYLCLVVLPHLFMQQQNTSPHKLIYYLLSGSILFPTIFTWDYPIFISLPPLRFLLPKLNEGTILSTFLAPSWLWSSKLGWIHKIHTTLYCLFWSHFQVLLTQCLGFLLIYAAKSSPITSQPLHVPTCTLYMNHICILHISLFPFFIKHNSLKKSYVLVSSL